MAGLKLHHPPANPPRSPPVVKIPSPAPRISDWHPGRRPHPYWIATEGGIMTITYRRGQRPLEGFTIKRGLGQGGFGEVYFAVSDGGKEVALKLLVRGRTDTELRGISNCLNFKHPNLVHLYDLKTDERGDHWLVMEYVHGEPLNAVLNRNPKGLPPDQARDWFLQVARAVAYLHDHAVVHRDIKPGNVFV